MSFLYLVFDLVLSSSSSLEQLFVHLKQFIRCERCNKIVPSFLMETGTPYIQLMDQFYLTFYLGSRVTGKKLAVNFSEWKI